MTGTEVRIAVPDRELAVRIEAWPPKTAERTGQML